MQNTTGPNAGAPPWFYKVNTEIRHHICRPAFNSLGKEVNCSKNQPAYLHDSNKNTWLINFSQMAWHSAIALGKVAITAKRVFCPF